MILDDKLVRRLEDIMTSADALTKSAAMLLREVRKGGPSVPLPKGSKEARNAEIRLMAKKKMAKKLLKQKISNDGNIYSLPGRTNSQL